jgi:N-acetylneuraminate lyase
VSIVQGILPALVTPFDESGRLAEGPFEQLLERVYSTNIDGVYVCGSTGEGLLQPLEQRKRVVELAVRNTPKGKGVIVHTGAYRTSDAVELTKHAAKAGAAAASSLPPIGAYSFDEIRAYYRALSTAADIPFLVYYFPAVAPAITSAAQLIELCSLPNVTGLKFTDYDFFKMSLIRSTGAAVFNGYDEVLAAGLLMGACGGIGTFYNLVPELFVEVWRLSQAGRFVEARAVQARINELIELTTRYPCFPAVKTILRWSGIDCGDCLEPRRKLTADEENGLRQALLSSSFAELAG